MLILKSKKEPSKERPCSALIIEGDRRFKQDFLTVYFREELCYNRHNGNGKIDIMLKDNSIIKKQEPRPLRTRLLLNGNRNLKFVYC